MAKDSDKPRGGFDMGETGGALSGLLAEEDEFDRRALWRLGTWAAVSVGTVIVALITNQSSIGLRREQSASADLLKQAQQLQLTAKEGQNETRRLASAVETLNSDRDRLYSRVAVLEQGLDSVTGAIARQSSTASSLQANTGQAAASQGTASQATVSQAAASAAPAGPSAASLPAAAAAPAASAAPTTTASVDPPPVTAKPSPAPVVAPVAATAPAVLDKTALEKQDKQASAATSSEPPPTAKSAAVPQPALAQQASGSLVASKSMMAPPDPAAGKLIEPAALPKMAATAPMPPMPVVAAVAPEVPEKTESDPPSELVVRRTEFGVDVGGANSIPGLRALWRGLLKSRANTALTKLRPIIVIKENNTGLGMQLRLVAGPINDAAAAAKICASLTVSDRSCSTSVFEGQRLALNADETDKTESSKPDASKVEADSKPESASKPSAHNKRYTSRHPKVVEDPPKPEPSTFIDFRQALRLETALIRPIRLLEKAQLLSLVGANSGRAFEGVIFKK